MENGQCGSGDADCGAVGAFPCGAPSNGRRYFPSSNQDPAIREHPELNDAVASGDLRLPVLRAAAVAWFVGALFPGIYLLQVVDPPAILLGVIAILAAAWYAAGPRSMAALGLADPVFFAMFGVVAVAATYYVQARAGHIAVSLPPSAFLVGLPVAALVTNVLVIDDIRDVEFDAAKGWRTTAVRFGVPWSRRVHLARRPDGRHIDQRSGALSWPAGSPRYS